jgi:hypothetical protein
MSMVDSFSVDHTLEYITRDMVPFDAYALNAIVFAIEKGTNESLPISTFAAGEGVSGFVISSYQVEAKYNWMHDSGTGPTPVKVQSSVIYIGVERSRLAKAFTVCLLIINSALTVGSAYVTLLALVRREVVNDTVLLLPVTIVLTIPALRSLYVGSPPFGIYLGKSPALRP